MGFNAVMQIATAKLSKNDRFKDGTVVELGNQRFRPQKKQVRRICEEVSSKQLRPQIQYVWEYLEDLGFKDYKAIDVNTELRAIAMDLNYVLRDKYDYEEQFDYVTNNGTGEHIFDQRVVFENMHNLCKVGGTMINILPFTPWFNHCFYSFHPQLFRDIAAANGYKWDFLWIAKNTGEFIDCPTDMDSWAFYEQKHPRNPVSKLEKTIDKLLKNGPANISVVAAYTKTTDAEFQIPFQGRYVNDMVEGVKENYSEGNKDTRQSNHTSAGY